MLAPPSKGALARQIAEKLDLRPLSYDYEILLDLYESRSATAGELRPLSRASDTTFYSLLKSLEARGLIESDADADDRRRRRYRVTDTTRVKLDQQYAGLPAWIDRKLSDQPGGDHGLRDFFRLCREQLRIRFFTPEFQILLVLFEYGSRTAGQLADLCDVSATSFYRALKMLSGKQLIVPDAQQADQRIKRYRLAQDTYEELALLHAQLREWVLRTLSDKIRTG